MVCAQVVIIDDMSADERDYCIFDTHYTIVHHTIVMMIGYTIMHLGTEYNYNDY